MLKLHFYNHKTLRHLKKQSFYHCCKCCLCKAYSPDTFQTHLVICLICQNTIAIIKKYNIKHHYCTKHAAKFDGIKGQLWFDEIEQFKKCLSSDGEFIKNFLELFIRHVFPEKKCVVEQLSLSQFTVARQIDHLSENVKLSLKQKISKYSAFSIALGKRNNISATVQLVF